MDIYRPLIPLILNQFLLWKNLFQFQKTMLTIISGPMTFILFVFSDKVYKKRAAKNILSEEVRDQST